MTTIEIELLHTGGDIAHAEIRYSKNDDFHNLQLNFDGEEFNAKGSDYFDSFCKIRRELDVLGWRPRCEGARHDVYPSGMCRDMGRGLKAYILEPGNSKPELVGIFDPITGNQPVAPDEQKLAYEQWLKSRGKKP